MQNPISLDLERYRPSLVQDARDHAVHNGIIWRTANQPKDSGFTQLVPHTLFPSPIPRHLFEFARNIQKDYNLLYHAVANDFGFLRSALSATASVDDFTKNMLDIATQVHAEGLAQPVMLGMHRSDYMFDTAGMTSQGDAVDITELNLKQIEFNTMSSSFGGLSQKITQHHRYLLSTSGLKKEADSLPENNAVDGLSTALYKAHQTYNTEKSVILFLCLEDERNIVDQRMLEFGVHRCDPSVRVVRASIQQMRGVTELRGPERRLFYKDTEVSVVYMRLLYVPEHYTSKEDWDTRLMMERSRAIKCPNIFYHLAGAKKIQQKLAEPGVLEKFLPNNPETVNNVRRTFAGQYSLDMGPNGDKIVDMVLKSPESFVMKPQREGGGHNYFGEDLREYLQKIRASEERTAYVIMERVRPAQVENYLLRAEEAETPRRVCVSELGVFGTFLGAGHSVLLNDSKGHILRTKSLGTDEGGVAAGFSALDSPVLI